MKKLLILSTITFLAACGLQVRDNSGSTTTGGGSNTGGNTALFTVGGHASGIPYRKGVTLAINGHNYTVNANGTFTFPQHFNSGTSYNVNVESSLGGAYACSLQNDTGTIANANVTNVLLSCSCQVGSLGTGTGTTANPILVYTATQLNTVAISNNSTAFSKEYKQVCDLDYTNMNPKPVGTSATSFTGVYDGNDFFILHYTSDQNTAHNNGRKGLFGWTNGAKLKNINLSDFSITANAGMGNSTNHARAGALVGTPINSQIENIYAEKITLNDNGQPFHGLGGVIGEQAPSNSASYLRKVHVEDVTIAGSSSENVGGVIGETEANSEKIEAHNINISGCIDHCGGIAGEIENCVHIIDGNAQGTIRGNKGVGGIIGKCEVSGEIERTYFVGTINGETTNGKLGGLVGNNTCSQPIKNSFTSSDILSVTGALDVGPAYGSSSSVVNVAFDSSQTCQNCSSNPGTLSRANANSFQNGTDSVMAAWDFSATWCLVSEDFPRLADVPYSVCE